MQPTEKAIELFKAQLPTDEDERFEVIWKLFKDTRDDIVKAEGTCDEEALIEHLCKAFELPHEDYMALIVSLSIKE